MKLVKKLVEKAAKELDGALKDLINDILKFVDQDQNEQIKLELRDYLVYTCGWSHEWIDRIIDQGGNL